MGTLIYQCPCNYNLTEGCILILDTLPLTMFVLGIVLLVAGPIALVVDSLRNA